MRRLWVLVGLVLIACGGGSPIPMPTVPPPATGATPSTSTVVSTVASNASPLVVSPAVAAIQKSGIGQRATNGTVGITVNAITDPLLPGRTAPKQGNRFVAVDFTFENLGSKGVDYNVTGAILRTSDDRQYHYGFANDVQPEPFFNYGTANPGDRIRGWVSFEIPADAKVTGFRYQYINGPLVTVNLP